MACHRLRPICRHLRCMGQQRLVPQQPDRQQVDKRHVRLALQFGLPQKPARMLRPTTQIHQHPVKGSFGGRIGQAHLVSRPQYNALWCIVGRGDKSAEPGQPGNFGRQIMRCPFAPGSKSPAHWCRRPQRLSPVEISCGPKAKTAGDDCGPIGIGHFGRQIGHRRQYSRGGTRASQRRLQQRQIDRLHRRPAGDQGCGQIIVSDYAFGDASRIHCSGLGDARACHTGQPGGGCCQIITGLAEEGVNGHRRVQRKGGRNGAGCSLGCLQYARDPGRADLCMVREHFDLQWE